MKPMKCQPYLARKFLPCFTQPKLNGIRALYQNGMFYSNDEKRFPPVIVQHLVDQLTTIDPQIILDGELYVHGWPLQRIQGAVAVNRETARPDTHLVEYHCFDLVASQGFSVRYAYLKQLLEPLNHPNIKLVPAHYCSDTISGDFQFEVYLNYKYEGLIYREDNHPYTFPHQGADQDNRTKFMQKRKGWSDDEFEIIGINPGNGKREGMVGSFTCKTKNGYTFNVGTGLGWTEEELTRYLIDQPIGKFLTVQYITLSNDGIPQNPSARTIRDYE